MKLRIKLWSIVLVMCLAIMLGTMLLPGTSPAQAQGGWTHIFDYVASQNSSVAGLPGGFACDYATSGEWGSYVGGTGWVSTGAGALGGGPNLCFHQPFLTGTVSAVRVYYDNSHAGDLYVCIGTSSCTGFGASGPVGGTNNSLFTFGSPITGNYFGLLEQNGAGSPNAFHITRIDLIGTGSDPYATPTPVASLTPTPTLIAPPSGGGSLGKVCQLIGLESSTFTRNPGQWVLNTGNILTPTILSPGLSLPEGSAHLSLSLDPNKEYTWQINYHITNTAGAPDSLSVQLGSDPVTSVPIAATLTEQTYTSPLSIYHPNSGSNTYLFTIEKAFHSPDPHAVIDFACVSTTNTSASGSPQVPAYLEASCSYCVYTPQGDLIGDLGRLFNWLICFLGQIWNCAFKSFAGGIWLAVANVLAFLAIMRLWTSNTFDNIGATATSDLNIGATWLGGLLSNIITAIGNLIGGLFNQSGATNFLNTVVLVVLAVIGAILQAIQDLATLISTALQSLGSLVAIPVNFLAHVWNLVTNVLGIIPQIIVAIVNGFNSSSSIPAYAANCTDPSSPLYTPCLGMYVLDNTIFSGPVYYLMPLAMGFVAFNTLLWTVRAVGEAMDRS